MLVKDGKRKITVMEHFFDAQKTPRYKGGVIGGFEMAKNEKPTQEYSGQQMSNAAQIDPAIARARAERERTAYHAELRLECLRVVTRNYMESAEDAVTAANVLYEFVISAKAPASDKPQEGGS